MPLWDKVKTELDRAGRVAQLALDEGRIRLELHRARQNADRVAAALGRAAFKAREAGLELTADEYEPLAAPMRGAKAEIDRLEEQLAVAMARGEGPKDPPAGEAQQPI